MATVLSIGAGLGLGPRDGLTTALATRCGWSVRVVRPLIEASVPAAGWLLGGTVGIGTMVYPLGIGPILALLLWATPAAAGAQWLGRSGPGPTPARRRRCGRMGGWQIRGMQPILIC